jgi:hypothetical protein
MGIVRRLKARAAAEAIKRFMGRDGMKWIQENKKLVGAVFAAAGAAAYAYGYEEAATILALIATHLGVAGSTKSDADAKASK